MRLHDYLGRVGVGDPGRASLPANLDTLRRVHVAHRESFLFENLAIQTGGVISVALDDIERKFLDGRHGGYCFEHNTLFGAALRELGFNTTALLGRVRRGPREGWCRTHMVLRVTIDGEPWLADVGFGAIGLLEPIPLREGATAQQVGLSYTVRREDAMWVLSCAGSDFLQKGSEPLGVQGVATTDLYEFSEDPQTAGDVEVANHYTATHPSSIFRRTLTIQRTTRTDRTLLRSGVLTRYRDGDVDEQPIDRARLPAVVREVFGIELPPGPFLFESVGISA
jgi:N-hydroxyarylamine O-acetyltransferase